MCESFSIYIFHFPVIDWHFRAVQVPRNHPVQTELGGNGKNIDRARLEEKTGVCWGVCMTSQNMGALMGAPDVAC